MTSSLQSLNLATILAGHEQSVGLPALLRSQASELRREGGSQVLYDMWDKVQEAAARNLEILDEAFNILDETQDRERAYGLKRKSSRIVKYSSFLFGKQNPTMVFCRSWWRKRNSTGIRCCLHRKRTKSFMASWKRGPRSLMYLRYLKTSWNSRCQTTTKTMTTRRAP